MRFLSPNGSPIVGTLETLKARYGHTTFTATSPKSLRRAILAAAKADASIYGETGVVRHTVWANGRQIGYEAIQDERGLHLTQIRRVSNFPRVHIIKSMADLREIAAMFRPVAS